MRQAIIHLLLPLMALGHCDDVVADPAKFVKAAEGWVNVLTNILPGPTMTRCGTSLSTASAKNSGRTSATWRG